MVVLKSQNHEARIQRHYHVLNIQKNPSLNQATQKNTCQILLPQKNPTIENFKPQKILQSSLSLEIQSPPPRWGKHDGVQNLLFSMRVVFLSLNLFLFIPYTNYIYKHELNSVDFAKKRTLIIICFLQCMFPILTKKIQAHQHVFPCKAKTHKTKFRAVFYLLDRKSHAKIQ